MHSDRNRCQSSKKDKPGCLAWLASRKFGCSLILVAGIALGSIPVVASGIPGRRNLADSLRHGPGNFNHPVGVVPTTSIRIPKSWPLDFNGSITCVTCHTSIPSLDASATVSLRGGPAAKAGGLTFCAKCHSSSGGEGSHPLHWMAMGSAHIRVGGNQAQHAGGSLDSESRRCLGCHDGVNAIEKAGGSGSSGLGQFGAFGSEHPIGVVYSPAGRGHRSARLRPSGLLPDTIRLPQGRVSCVSCHNLYARNEHLLSASMDQSALCFTCHDMD